MKTKYPYAQMAYCMKGHANCVNPTQCFCSCHKAMGQSRKQIERHIGALKREILDYEHELERLNTLTTPKTN